MEKRTKIRIWARFRQSWGMTWPEYRSGACYYVPCVGIGRKVWVGGNWHYSKAGAIHAARLARRLIKRGIDPSIALDTASSYTKCLWAEREALREKGRRRLKYLCRLGLTPAYRQTDGRWETWGIPSSIKGYWTEPFARMDWPRNLFLNLALAPIDKLLDVVEETTGRKFLIRVRPAPSKRLDPVPRSPLNLLTLELQTVEERPLVQVLSSEGRR